MPFDQELSHIKKDMPPHPPMRLQSKKRKNHKDVMHAVADGLYDELMMLSKEGVIDEVNEQGCSPLQIAARHNDVPLMKMLVSAGANVNAQGIGGFTPLHFAARFNSIDAVKFLLEKNADATINCSSLTIPLHVAARRGFLEVVKLLVKRDSSTVNAKAQGDVTPIYLACKNGDSTLCQWLIDNEADITYVTIENKTPLHHAAINGNYDAVKVLIETASKKLTNVKDYIDITEYEGRTALHFACIMGHDKIAQELISSGADVHAQTTSMKESVLHVAVCGGSIPIMETLLKNGANIETVDWDHRTPLHRAASSNNVEVIKFLLEKGAKIDSVDIKRRTPFLLAVKKNNPSAAAELLEQGANMKAVDVDLKTCFHLAVESQSLSTLDLLISKDDCSLLRRTDLQIQNPLHYAAAIGDIEIIKRLLPKSELDDVDASEMTALHIAAMNGSVHATEILAMASPKCISVQDRNGRTPLHCAAENGYKKTCAVLLELGSVISSRDYKRRSPLHAAVDAGAVNTVKLLLSQKDSQLLSMLDEDENSALHLACAREQVDIVKALLDNGDDVTILNKKGQTCLDIAIDWELEDVATVLVKHARWWEIMGTQNKDGYGPMKKLIEVLPDVAKIVLNQCLDASDLPSHSKDYWVEFQFKLLDPGPDDPPGLRGEPYDGPTVMVENNREELLNHPLTQALLRYKWLTYGKLVFYLNFAFFIVLALLYTYFIISERESVKLYYSSSKNATLVQKRLLETADSRSVMSIAGALTFMVLIQFMKEFYQLVMLKLEYFKSLSNYMELILNITALLFLLPYLVGDMLYSSSAAQWNSGVIALFLFYVDFLLYIQRLGKGGIYVSMYFEVWYSFIRLIGVFIVVLFGSNAVFYVLLREEDNFSSIWFSFVKTTVMMVGELDYSDVLSDNVVNKNINSKSGVPYVPLPEITYILFVVFMIAVPVLLMNLLVGIAVGDIEAIQKTASFALVKDQVKFVLDAQKRYPSGILRYLYRDKIRAQPNRNKYMTRFLLSGTNVDDDSYIETLLNIKSVLANDKTKEEQEDPFEKQKIKLREIEAKLERQHKLMTAIAEKIGVVLTNESDTQM